MTLQKYTVFLLIGVVLILPSFSQSNAYNISGSLEIPSKKGTVYIYLVDRSHFDIPNSGVDTLEFKVSSKSVSYEFTDVPQGTYALRCVQDLNGNRKLDKGLFGPTEPWALSWNRKKKFPPKFEDLSFFLTADLTMNFTLEK